MSWIWTRVWNFYKKGPGSGCGAGKKPHLMEVQLVYLGDGKTSFTLELTWLRDRSEPYNLGDEEFHLAMASDDFDALHQRHKEMGCICFENPDMGIYFINDRNNRKRRCV